MMSFPCGKLMQPRVTFRPVSADENQAIKHNINLVFFEPRLPCRLLPRKKRTCGVGDPWVLLQWPSGLRVSCRWIRWRESVYVHNLPQMYALYRTDWSSIFVVEDHWVATCRSSIQPEGSAEIWCNSNLRILDIGICHTHRNWDWKLRCPRYCIILSFAIRDWISWIENPFLVICLIPSVYGLSCHFFMMFHGSRWMCPWNWSRLCIILSWQFPPFPMLSC